MTQFIQICR